MTSKALEIYCCVVENYKPIFLALASSPITELHIDTNKEANRNENQTLLDALANKSSKNSLSATGRALTSDIIKQLFDPECAFTRLSFVQCHDNAAKLFAHIPPLFLSNRTITKLILSKNTILPDSLKHIFLSLESSPIAELGLASVNLQRSRVVDTLSETVKKLSSTLKVLDVGSNGLDDNSVKLLCNALSVHDSVIKDLDISNNEFASEGCKAVSDLLCASKLTSINLSDNTLTERFLVNLPAVLLINTLKHLKLDGIPSLNSKHLSMVGRVIQNTQSLKSISLARNNLDTKGVADIATAIVTNKTLTSLNLSNVGNGLPPLPGCLHIVDCLFYNTSIKKVDVSGWQETLESAYIPEMIAGTQAVRCQCVKLLKLTDAIIDMVTEFYADDPRWQYFIKQRTKRVPLIRNIIAKPTLKYIKDKGIIWEAYTSVDKHDLPGLKGCSCWMPPSRRLNIPFSTLLMSSTKTLLRVGLGTATKIKNFYTKLDKWFESTCPKEAWVVVYSCIDVRFKNDRLVWDSVMQQGCEVADHENRRVWTFLTDESLIPFYQNYGFEEDPTKQLIMKNGPKVFSVERPPQAKDSKSKRVSTRYRRETWSKSSVGSSVMPLVPEEK